MTKHTPQLIVRVKMVSPFHHMSIQLFPSISPRKSLAQDLQESTNLLVSGYHLSLLS